MTRRHDELDRADAEALSAKQRLTLSLDDAKVRLSPSSLRKEASDKAMDYALNKIAVGKVYASNHPMQIVGAALVCGAIAGRRPIWALLRPSIVKGFTFLKQWRHEE